MVSAATMRKWLHYYIVVMASFTIQFGWPPSGSGSVAATPTEAPSVFPPPSSAQIDNVARETRTLTGDRDADELFSLDNKVPIFKLTLPSGAFEQLQADALLEEYVESTLTYNNEEVVGIVGLRFKGASGTLKNCFDDDGNRICEKLSMKIKFNEVDKDLRFFGLKKLNFHSMEQDGSRMVERISYKAFRDAGIVAPRSSWARLVVNDEELGLFALVEQIDGRFTDDRFQEGDGDLYKEAWPKMNDPSYYAEHIKTNEDEATHDRIRRFAVDMLAAAPEDRLETLGQWTSLSQMYTYMAVQDAVAQWDGVTAWYCATGDTSLCGNHNFYWYSQETSDHFTLLPWDMDATLQSSNSIGNDVPHWTHQDIDCNTTYFPIPKRQHFLAPGCDPILNALASDMDQYAKSVDRVLKEAFDIEKIANDIKIYSEFIRDEVERDNHSGFGGSLLLRRWRWNRAIVGIEKGLPLLKLRLEGYRDGRVFKPGVIGTMQEFINILLTGIFPQLSWWSRE